MITAAKLEAGCPEDMTPKQSPSASRSLRELIWDGDTFATGFGSDWTETLVSKAIIAKEVLEEVPGQLKTFMKSKGIKPL